MSFLGPEARQRPTVDWGISEMMMRGYLRPTRAEAGQQFAGFNSMTGSSCSPLFQKKSLVRMVCSPLGLPESRLLPRASMIFLHRLLSVFLILVLPFLLVALDEFRMLCHPALIALVGLLFVVVVIFPLLLSASLFVGEIPFSLALFGSGFLKERIDFPHFRTLQKELKMSTVTEVLL